MEAVMASNTVPENFKDLFKKQAFANLATLNADGSPQVTPVWVDFDGANIVVNTARGRVKDKNLRREKRVALTILDPENPYRYLGVQGRVVEMTEQGADAHIDQMAKKYLNKDTYPFRAPGESAIAIDDGDVFVVAQKFVSKAEGAVVPLADVAPSPLARDWAARYGKDPAVVEVVLRESSRIVRMDRGIIIAETRNGFICANAGVDASNAPLGFVTLLPRDPDASAS